MTATRALRWWQTAPNPECASFCTGEHAADEFNHGGAFLCAAPIRSFDDSSPYEIEAQQLVSVVGDDEVLVRDPANLFIDIIADVYFTPEQAEQFAADITAGATLVREVNR